MLEKRWRPVVVRSKSSNPCRGQHRGRSTGSIVVMQLRSFRLSEVSSHSALKQGADGLAQKSTIIQKCNDRHGMSVRPSNEDENGK